MDQFLPRVMIVCSHGFNHVTGTGVTLTNLFRGWPKDALACVNNDTVPAEDEVCDRVFELGVEEIDKVWPISLLPRAQAGKLAISGGGQAAAVPQRSGPLARVRNALFGAEELPESARISARLDAFIREFRPQVVYTLLGNNAMMRLVRQICDRYALPLVVHVMDDWKKGKYAAGLLSPLRRAAMLDLMRHLVGRAAVRMGICDSMCEAYGREFGGAWLPFQNTVDARLLATFARTDLAVGNPVRMVYAGSVLPFAQLDSLIETAAAVQHLADGGFPIQLDVYTPAFMLDGHRDRLAVGPAVRLNDPVKHGSEYFRVLAGADILALPVNFDGVSVDFIRYSMPTKVPEYLLAGVPILAYGPPHVAQISYALGHGWADVVERRDPALLAEAIRRVATDEALRTRLVACARQVGQDRHDGENVRRSFRAALAGAAQSQGNAQ